MSSIATIVRVWAVTMVGWALLLPGAALVARDAGSATPVRALGGLVYMAGAALCHQRPERTFHLSGVPLPVCARCTGIYCGAAAAVLLLAAARWPSMGAHGAEHDARAVRLMLAGAVAVNAGTLLWEWAAGHPPTHLVRASAGALLGAAAAWAVWLAGRSDLQSG